MSSKAVSEPTRRTIVVGLGDHTEETEALSWACALAEAEADTLKVFTSLPRSQAQYGRCWLQRTIQQRRAELAELLDRLGHVDDDITVAASASTVDAFNTYLRSCHPDLVVLGSGGHRHRATSDHHLATELLARAAIPVTIVRTATPRAGPILLVQDPQHPLRRVGELAASLHARLGADVQTLVLGERIEAAAAPAHDRGAARTPTPDPLNQIIEVERNVDPAAVVLPVSPTIRHAHQLDPFERQLLTHLSVPVVLVARAR